MTPLPGTETSLIISEFGGDALFGLHGDKDVRWIEECQKDAYEHQVAMLRKIPSLRGMSPWILTDFARLDDRCRAFRISITVRG